jgi:hypothetical protein
MELTMAESVELNRIQIDRMLGDAIRRDIGERLRRVLEAEGGPAPPRLRMLLEQLAARDRGDTSEPSA